MKQYFLSGLCLFLTTLALAQAPSWDWATMPTGTGTGSSSANALATDASGNVYSGGYFGTTTFTLGATTFTKKGPQNMYFAKYDLSGNVLWAASAPDSGLHNLYGIALDANGDVYITGSYNSATLTFSPTIVLTNQGLSDIFLAKYSALGVPIWAASLGGANTESTPSLSIGSDGNVVITASFNTPTLTIGNVVLTNSGVAPSYDLFVAKYDGATGAVLWALSAGAGGEDRAGEVATDGSGNIYLTGYYNSASISFGPTTLNNNGGNDIFIAKYDATGSPVWAVSAGGSGNEQTTSIAVDVNGSSYITGWFEASSFNIGATTLVNPSNPGNNLNYDYFLAKYDASGLPAWATSVGGGQIVRGNGLALDGAGNICVTGGFNASSLNFGGIILSNPASTNQTPTYDIFVAKYTSGGSLLWALSAGGSAAEHGFAIASDPNGNTYISGYTHSTSLIFGPITLTGPSGQKPYLARLAPPCTIAPAQPAAISGATTVCSGSSQTYSVPLVTGAVSYSWSLPSGWSGTSTTNSIAVTAGTAAGDISVAAVNACGTGTSQLLAVTTLAAPTPTITQSGLTLSTASGQGTYQWYKNGVAIPGATSNSYTVTVNASYYVRVTNGSNCSGQSNTITITSIKGKKRELYCAPVAEVNVYPNPNNGSFTVSVPFAEGITRITITDVAGKLIKTTEITEYSSLVPFNVQGITAGLYFLTIRNGEEVYRTTLSIK